MGIVTSWSRPSAAIWSPLGEKKGWTKSPVPGIGSFWN
jgi:hypothetical protein